MKNENIISNPKTIRRYQRLADTQKLRNEFADKNGYEVFKSFRAGSNSTWSFRLNGIESAYGFDSPEEAFAYIFNNKPSTP